MSNRNNRSHSIWGILCVAAVVVLFLRGCGRSGSGSVGRTLVSAYIYWTSILAIMVIVITVAVLLVIHFTGKKKKTDGTLEGSAKDITGQVTPVAAGNTAGGNNDAILQEAHKSTDPHVKALVPYASMKDVGKVAGHAIQQLLTLEQKEGTLMDLVDEKFMRGSITYDRFATTIQSGTDTIRANSEVLAGKLSNFDGDDYVRISNLVETGAYRRDLVDDEIQIARYESYQKQIMEMKKIIDANEKLILTLDECHVELSKLESKQLDQESEKILKEIDELAKTTKYYA